MAAGRRYMGVSERGRERSNCAEHKTGGARAGRNDRFLGLLVSACGTFWAGPAGRGQTNLFMRRGTDGRYKGILVGLELRTRCWWSWFYVN